MKATRFIRKLIPLLFSLLVLAACTNSLQNEPPELDTLATNELYRGVYATSDDAEQAQNGTVYLTSPDLDMVYDSGTSDRGKQTVGLRFTNISIPKGATIDEATVQFATDEATSTPTTITVRAMATDNPSTFTTSTNLAGASKTSERIIWNVDPWTTVGERGTKQKTPDFDKVVQEIVNRSGWKSGNAIALIIEGGQGSRAATARDKVAYESSSNPTLYIKWSTSGTTPPPPPARATCFNSGSFSSTKKLDAKNYGASGSTYKPSNDGVTSGMRIDARAASFVDPNPARVNDRNNDRGSYFPVSISGLNNLCLSGGFYNMGLPDDLKPSDVASGQNPYEWYHHGGNIGVYGSSNVIIEGLDVKIAGDGIGFNRSSDYSKSNNWKLRDSYFRHVGDDALENDYMYNGTVDNVLFDWVYHGISCRIDTADWKDWDSGKLGIGPKSGGGSIPGKVTVQNTLMALRPQIATFGDDSPGYIDFFKWQVRSNDSRPGCGLALKNNVFYAAGNVRSTQFERIADYVDTSTCQNNLIVYTGSGSFDIPSKIAQCFTVTKDKSKWTNARNDWFDRHPEFEKYRNNEPTGAS